MLKLSFLFGIDVRTDFLWNWTLSFSQTSPAHTVWRHPMITRKTYVFFHPFRHHLTSGNQERGAQSSLEGRKAYSAVYLSLGYAFSCLISQRALSRSRVTSSIQHVSESRTGCCRYGERHLELSNTVSANHYV